MSNVLTVAGSKRRMLIAVPLCLLCVVFFLLQPNLDLKVSGLFFDGSFYWNENPFVRFVYLVFAKIHAVYLLVLIGLAIYYARKKLPIKKMASLFLLVSLILGPGILVNLVLKDNSVGRPRPVHVQNFGGDAIYTPVFHYSGACQKNCSFVSGHAAIGFYLMALFWVSRKRRWLISGIALGAIVGLGRIVQGGHFFSDVIFAGWVVFFCCEGLSLLMLSKPTQENT